MCVCTAFWEGGRWPGVHVFGYPGHKWKCRGVPATKFSTHTLNIRDARRGVCHVMCLGGGAGRYCPARRGTARRTTPRWPSRPSPRSVWWLWPRLRRGRVSASCASCSGTTTMPTCGEVRPGACVCKRRESGGAERVRMACCTHRLRAGLPVPLLCDVAASAPVRSSRMRARTYVRVRVRAWGSHDCQGRGRATEERVMHSGCSAVA
jgi:hypothetical protein